MPDLGTISVTFHAAVFVGAIAAWYKYGDRTDLTDKSLKGTKEALDGLRAYLGRALAEAVRPTVERVVANMPFSEAALEELHGEAFQDDVSSFVISDIGEMLSYRMLVHARNRWSAWSRRISWTVFVLVLIEAVCTCYFVIATWALNRPTSLPVLLATFIVSVVAFGFCILCAGMMLHYHDKISLYRDKVL